MGILAIPLLLGVGLAVDYSRHVSAHSHLQELADGTSLMLASSREKDKEKLLVLANEFVSSNIGVSKFGSVQIADLKTEDDKIDLSLKAGSTHTSWTRQYRHAGCQRLGAGSACGHRKRRGGACPRQHLVDVRKRTPRGSARSRRSRRPRPLSPTELLSNKDAVVRIGLVPYADYVNVGTIPQRLLAVGPDDYVVQPAPKVCQTLTTKETSA